MQQPSTWQMDFTGKRVWVTGAGRGIGEQIARAFVALGGEVIGFDLAFPSGDASWRQIALDIGQTDAVRRVCRQLLSDDQGPDVLVNAAGILRMGALEALSDDDWQQCLNVNVGGAFRLLRELIPHFQRQRRGAIVTVGSNAGHVPRMQMGAYCASKAALASLSHCAGLELAEYGVRCNLVSPGSTDTQMQRALWRDASGERQTIQGFPQQHKLGIPLGKIARAEEIAAAVVFLASDLASHITLQDIVVDGGAILTA